MPKVAPKSRKHLSADALFRVVRNGFCEIADHRDESAEIPLHDALMSGFAMFSLKWPSLLAYDEKRAEGNLQSIYGIERAPSDSTMREIIDPIDPESMRPLFKRVLRELQRGKALKDLVFLDDHYLLALDGTGYFSSKKIHCASCLEKRHRDGSTTYYHQMLGAALIHPDFRDFMSED